MQGVLKWVRGVSYWLRNVRVLNFNRLEQSFPHELAFGVGLGSGVIPLYDMRVKSISFGPSVHALVGLGRERECQSWSAFDGG